MHSILRYILILPLLMLCSSRCLAVADTVKLYFNLDEDKLPKRYQEKLDSMVYNDIIRADQDFFIIGYADYVGSPEYNLDLSERRARYIQGYLAGIGVNKTSIKLVGRGEISRNATDPKGYAPDRRVDIVMAAKGKPIKKDSLAIKKFHPAMPADSISLITAERGDVFVLDKIFFYPGRHIVRETSLPELDYLYKVLERNPSIKIRIEGHVCCVPMNSDALDEDTFEKALSVNRAKYIYAYLAKRGIDPKRLSYVGYGRRKPLVAVERSLEDETKNRRVEIRIIEN